ncbi:MAG: sulfatase-like hydrolase/transferase [Spirochaetaceae bacterium]|nr:MAG: sulfatase-like hydrolase/transferase [Spirochaetaceae bacterium]
MNVVLILSDDQGAGLYCGAPLINEGRIYHEPRYVTEVITENALIFLKGQANAERPFYLSIHYTAPHSPWDRANHPPELYDRYFQGCPFGSIPVEPMHSWQINTAHYGEGERRRELLSGYFTAVTAMDSVVGRILKALEIMLLVGKYRLSGTHIHDANVVAALSAHGLSKLVTENQGDFSLFSEVETVGLSDIYKRITSSS